MTKSEIEKILKSLAEHLIKDLAIKKVIAAICDKENTPMLIIHPHPKKIDEKNLKRITNAFAGKLYPVIGIQDENMVIRYVEPKKVSNCSPVVNKESKIPSQLFKDDEECIEIYREVVINKEPAILFFKKDGCKYCDELEYYLYKEGAGFSDEEIGILERVMGLGIIYVDADRCKNLQKVFGVKVFPTLIYMKNGKPALRFERFGLNSEVDKKRFRDFILGIFQDVVVDKKS